MRAVSRVGDDRHRARGRDGPQALTLLEYADGVAPGSTLVGPGLDQPQPGPVGQRLPGVRIEAVAVDRIAVDGSRGRRDREGEAVGLQDAEDLAEHAPELSAVLEHLPGQDQIHRTIREGKTIDVGQHHIDTGAGFEIDADVVAPGRQQLVVRAVDVHRAEIHNLQWSAIEAPIDAPTHVFHR